MYRHRRARSMPVQDRPVSLCRHRRRPCLHRRRPRRGRARPRRHPECPDHRARPRRPRRPGRPRRRPEFRDHRTGPHRPRRRRRPDQAGPARAGPRPRPDPPYRRRCPRRRHGPECRHPRRPRWPRAGCAARAAPASAPLCVAWEARPSPRVSSFGVARISVASRFVPRGPEPRASSGVVRWFRRRSSRASDEMRT